MKPRRVVPARNRALEPYPTPRRRAALGAAAACVPTPTARPTGPSPATPPGRTTVPVDAVDLSIDLAPGRPGGLHLRNPILVASGTFGYGIEYGDVVDVQGLGAICCKGTTLKARVGNQPPRVTETPAGMLNSIGLQNPGVDAVIEQVRRRCGPLAGPRHRQCGGRIDRGLRRRRAAAGRRAGRGGHRAQHQLP